MKYSESNDRVVVSTDGTDGPYILVDHDRLAELCTVLGDNRIPYSSDPDAVENNNKPSMSVINLSDDADITHIQRLLDGMK